MANITDFSHYLEENKQIKLGDKIYNINETNGAYLNFKKKMKELEKSEDDTPIMMAILENGLGKDEAKEVVNNMPMRIVRDICDEITEAWMGQRIFRINTESAK